jgi:anti-anti-sigma regulatory factor
MIREVQGTPGLARVMGSLTSDTVQALLDAVDGGASALDLSEVEQIDDAAVRALAGLCLERYTLVACPRWLELWLARAREPGR